MELELKHVSPYLPYELNLKVDYFVIEKEYLLVVENNSNCFGNGLNINEVIRFKAKLLLRPLSQIQSYFEPLWDSDIDVRTYLSEEYITSFGFESIEDVLEHKVEWWPVGFYTTLLKHHFDVFDLIENRLATIKE